MNSSVQAVGHLRKKIGSGMKRYLFLLIFSMFLTVGCSALPVYFGNNENLDRFALAVQSGQFVAVNQSVDCKGTKVTIEKILLDKTHTFMIAAVDGEIKGTMDYLTVDLFGDQDQELGRSTFSQKLPAGKILLTFDALGEAPVALRLEFFGGPVGYGENVILSLNDINYKTVDGKYTQEYRLAETMEQKGFRLAVDSIEKGISETGLHYQLTALGDYDGIEHGWLSAYWHKTYPQILFLSDNGRNLEPHLSGINSFGPSSRASRNGKALVGRAYFDEFATDNLQVKLTDIYGYYKINELIPLDGVKDKLDINRKLPVNNYSVYLKSFTRGKDKGTWILNYCVLDSAGQPVDGAIDAGIYLKNDNYRTPFPILLDSSHNPVGQDQMLVYTGNPPESKDGLLEGAALKITRLGIRQKDAVLNIDLENPSKPGAKSDKTEIMAAVREYYTTFGRALKSNDLAVLAQK